MTIRWQGLWAMVAASIWDILIVTQYVNMSLPSMLVNYDCLSKRRMDAQKRKMEQSCCMSLCFFFHHGGQL